jgi:hypothetical protein
MTSTFVHALTGYWLFSPPEQVGAYVPAIACERSRYPPFPTAVQVADAPIELLQRVLRRLAIALHLTLELTDPGASLRFLRVSLRVL